MEEGFEKEDFEEIILCLSQTIETFRFHSTLKEPFNTFAHFFPKGDFLRIL